MLLFVHYIYFMTKTSLFDIFNRFLYIGILKKYFMHVHYVITEYFKVNINCMLIILLIIQTAPSQIKFNSQ